jgi:F0F1-type ATP synthase assembly protein I
MVKQDNYSSWVKYMGLGSQLLVLIGLAVYGGIKLDAKLTVSPLFIILLPLLALSITFYQIIKETTQNKNKQNENPR